MEKQQHKKTVRKLKTKKPLTKDEWFEKLFGKLKIFGDGVAYQRKLRDE
jgi:hypothetical protein